MSELTFLEMPSADRLATVQRLLAEGLTQTDAAKRLGVGKGLIAGLLSRARAGAPARWAEMSDAQRLEQLRTLRGAGVSLAEAARRLNGPRVAVAAFAAERGVFAAKARWFEMDPADRLALVRRRLSEGASHETIGAELGVSKALVGDLARAEGLPRRAGRGRRATVPSAGPKAAPPAALARVDLPAAEPSADRLDDMPERGVPFLQRRSDQCAMPLWMGGVTPKTIERAMVCGAPTADGSSWCPDCRRRVIASAAVAEARPLALAGVRR